MILAGLLRLVGPRRARLAATAAAIGAAALVGSAIGEARGSDAPVDGPTATIVVATRAVPAGAAIAPGDLALRTVPAAIAPRVALTAIETAAFRRARVAIPAGMPLVPALLAAPGAAGARLAPGERAVGIRVDEASGARGLAREGRTVDVVAIQRGALVTLAVGVAVIGVGEVTADGARRVVLVRVPAAVARRLAAADLAGLELRLLATGAG